MSLTQIVNPIIYPYRTISRRFTAVSPFKTLNPQFSRHPPHALSRRLFLPSVSSIWDAITGGGDSNPREAIAAVRRGMQLFRQVKLENSDKQNCSNKRNSFSFGPSNLTMLFDMLFVKGRCCWISGRVR